MPVHNLKPVLTPLTTVSVAGLREMSRWDRQTLVLLRLTSYLEQKQVHSVPKRLRDGYGDTYIITTHRSSH